MQDFHLLSRRIDFSLSFHFLLGNSLDMNNPHAIAGILLVDILAYLYHLHSPSGKEIGRSPIFNSKMVQFWTFFNLTDNPGKQDDQLFLKSFY